MAGMLLHVNSGEVALVGAAAKSVLQIKAPANQRLLVRSIGLWGKQTAGGSDTVVKVRMTRVASGGAFGTFTAATPVKNNPSLPETIQSAAGSNATVEPTATDGGRWWELQPQNGIEELNLVPPIEIAGGASIQLEFTSSATPTVVATASYEE